MAGAEAEQPVDRLLLTLGAAQVEVEAQRLGRRLGHRLEAQVERRPAVVVEPGLEPLRLAVGQRLGAERLLPEPAQPARVEGVEHEVLQVHVPTVFRAGVSGEWLSRRMTDHDDLIRRYWDAADRRDWDGFAATLRPDVVYEVPQTRERVRGREAYLRFNRDYPGDWRVTVRRVVADDTGGVAWTDFAVGEEAQTGIHFFTIGDDGLITRVDDFWPEPYDPPPGRDHLVERF